MTSGSAGGDRFGHGVDDPACARAGGQLGQADRPSKPVARQAVRAAARAAGHPGSGGRGIPARSPGIALTRFAVARPVRRPVSSVLSGTSTAPIRVSAMATCTQRALLGMISPTRVPLPMPASMNAAAKSACGRVQFAVADARRRIDHHRLGAVVGGAEPHQLVDGVCGHRVRRARRVRHRTTSSVVACRPCRWTATVFRCGAGPGTAWGSCTPTIRR